MTPTDMKYYICEIIKNCALARMLYKLPYCSLNCESIKTESIQKLLQECGNWDDFEKAICILVIMFICIKITCHVQYRVSDGQDWFGRIKYDMTNVLTSVFDWSYGAYSTSSLICILQCFIKVVTYSNLSTVHTYKTVLFFIIC